MAASNSLQDPLKMLQKEAMCAICVDYFIDPVSIGCGHSFCRLCVSLLWETVDDSDEWADEEGDMSSDSETSSLFSPHLFACPMCHKTFSRRNFRPNWQLGNMVQIIRAMCEASYPLSWENGDDVCSEHQEAPENVFEADNELSCEMCQVCKHEGGASGEDDSEEEVSSGTLTSAEVIHSEHCPNFESK